jgi:hypothetical protein
MMATTTAVPPIYRASRKRRLATWLLAGWTVFWFSSVLEPCSRGPITSAQATVYLAGKPVAAGGSAQAEGSACEHSCLTPLDTPSIPRSISAAPFPTLDAGGQYSAMPSLPLRVRTDDHALRRGDEDLPPGVPTYLRISRLLI